MAFKLNNPPYKMDPTPVYSVNMQDGILGKANRNGTIIIDENLPPCQAKEVIKHEQVHINQMRRGDLDYDDKYVYWKGKKYSRAKMKEGSPMLAWEREAYNKSKN
jgi:hypothetical protein